MSAILRSSFVRWPSVGLALVIATALPARSDAAGPAAPPAPAAQPAPGPAAPPAVAVEPTASEPDHERLIAEGDRLVAEGKPAEGAEQLSSAYRQMPTELRVGDVGRFVIVAASNAYESAWQATADAKHLEANQALLKAYLADLEAARAAGQATSAADEHEAALRERSAAIEQVIADPAPAADPVPAPIADPTTVEPQLELTFPPPDPRLRRNALVLVGAGAAGAVLGAAMVVAGAVTASRAEEQRTSMLAEEAGDARRSKLTGTIVATGGALVFSGSVMMLGVGSNRLGELRREMALTLRPTLTGVVLRGRF